MRSLVLEETRRLAWHDVPDPERREEREAIVRPLAVATCDLDAAIVSGRTPYEGPFAFGHECVARVVEGPGTGALVSVPFQVSCGECEKCRRGLTGNCTAVPRLSMYGFGPFGGDWGGFLSDRVRVPFAEHMLTPLPEGVSAEAAASVSDNLADAWRTVGPQLEAEPGGEVLITSLTPSLGLYAAAIALALGAGRVVYCDRDAERLRRAEELGAEAVEGFPERLGSFPITVDVSGEHEGLALALRSTAGDGHCTVASIFFEPATPLPMLEMYTKCVTVTTGRVHARPVAPRLLELMSSGRLQPERVAGTVVAWDDAPDALADNRGKLVISRT